MFTRLAVLLGAGLAIVLPVSAQSPQSPPAQTGTALILGQVLDGSTEGPMPGVVVTLNTPAATPAPAPTGLPVSTAGPRRAITDPSGRFVFHGLPAGRYSFSISSASGALIGGYGMRRPGGLTQVFELAEGQRVGDVVVRAWKYGAVGGTVTDQDGDPVVETRVSLLRMEIVAGHRVYRAGPTAMTDDRGMYRIPRVDPGEYTAYLPYQQMTLPVEVQAEYDTTSARGSTARDEFARTYGVDTSNLNGSGLRIGDHLLVRASNVYGADGPLGASFMSPPPDATGRVLVYPMMFHPGVTALSEATTFTVDSGQEHSGIDLRVRLAPGFQVSGRVAALEGPASIVTVRLVAQSAGAAAEESAIHTAMTVTNATGDFTFLGVPAGSYQLKVSRVPNTSRPPQVTSVSVGGTTTYSIVDDSNLPPLPLPDTPTESQSMAVAVGNQDIRGLAVQLQRGPRISGRVNYDGTAQQLSATQLVRVGIALDPIDGRTSPGATGKGQFEENGQFRTLGLVPGRYLIRLIGSLGPWSLDSVSVGGRGLPDQPLVVGDRDIPDVVITLTDHPAQLSGSVRDGRSGQADGNAIVLLFPADRASWVDTSANPRRLRSARVSSRGSYQLAGLPSGDYFAVAIDDRFSAGWQDRQRLESLSRAGTRVSIVAGDRKTLDLTAAVIR